MTIIIISFPPSAGGNHLKNILTASNDSEYFLTMYNNNNNKSFHRTPGSNLKKEDCINAISQPGTHILHGHFGEIMAHQKYIDQMLDKKFIILSPDTSEDRRLLRTRTQLLGQPTLDAENYFDQEQVFLYEPFIYNRYFRTSMSNIMNISISEWFTNDIDSVIERLNQFLNCKLDTEYVKQLHSDWIGKAVI